jgi:AraC-like DNA-binding protein
MGDVLDSASLLARDGLELADVACRHPRGRGEAGEVAHRHGIVFVRRGYFVRSADGVETILDPTLAYCVTPSVEQRFDHPHDDGDDCTALFLDDELIQSMWGGDRDLPVGPIATTPATDLEHRLLLSAARRAVDDHSVFERSLLLVARMLEQHDPRPVGSGRPATARARAALVDGARELLAADPQRSLTELAGELAASPHHLSRIFRRATGHTISAHRIRLRVRAALERLAGGDDDLARLAAELGFTDQSHLSRSVRAETRATPGALRSALGTGDFTCDRADKVM